MNNIKYIGIDVHQATSVFAVSNREGRIVAEAILETRATEIIDFLKSQRGTLWVTLEEGTYANWLYDVIKPHVSKLVVCDPRQNKQHGSKTDKIDAKKLANLLRSNSLKAVYHGEDGTLDTEGTGAQLHQPSARQHAGQEPNQSDFPWTWDCLSGASSVWGEASSGVA